MLVVCGEALMDVFSTGETATGLSLRAHVGGSPFNVAVGLARLARPVALLGAISSDFLGARLMRALESEGVSTATVVRTAKPTTLSLVGLDANGVPAYAFYGTEGADRQLTPETLPARPPGVRAYHFGSYSTVVEPTASALRALVEAERGRCVISYDPNVRLNVEPALKIWTDEVEWMLSRTHLLKVSDEDLSLLYPGAAPETLAASWLGKGVRLLVVTRGAKGAVAWTRGARVEVPGVPTTVVDTVGAGDTFQAALLCWLDERDLLTPAALEALDRARVLEAVQFAVLAASITCSRAGADLPRRAELPR
jgi:fructokinase